MISMPRAGRFTVILATVAVATIAVMTALLLWQLRVQENSSTRKPKPSA
jgi:hypothetical protein